MWSQLLVGITNGPSSTTSQNTCMRAHTHTHTHIHSLALGYLITHFQLPLCIWFFSNFIKFIVVSQLDFSVPTLVFSHLCLCPFLSLFLNMDRSILVGGIRKWILFLFFSSTKCSKSLKASHTLTHCKLVRMMSFLSLVTISVLALLLWYYDDLWLNLFFI